MTFEPLHDQRVRVLDEDEVCVGFLWLWLRKAGHQTWEFESCDETMIASAADLRAIAAQLDALND